MKKTAIYLSALAGAILWFYSCGRHDEAQHVHDGNEAHDEPHEAESAHSADEIIFTPEQAEAAGLKVETVTPGDFAQVIKTGGQILAAEGQEQTVVATTAGVVALAKPTLTAGVAVQAGEPLFTITSQGVVDGDPVEKARAEYAAAQSDYERAERLVQDRLMTARDFEAARLRMEQARAAYEGVGAKRSARGGTAVSAPMAGYVKTRLVAAGEYVTVGRPLLVVTQNKRLRLQAEVSERYYDRLAGVADANFRLSYSDSIYSLQRLNGRLLSVGRSSAASSYYLPVTFEFDNVGTILPGSIAEIWLLSAPRAGVISIPTSALTEEQGVYFVYLQLDAEGYKKQEVTLGQNAGDRVEVLRGLQAGDVVVTAGAYQVKLASASGVIPEGHSH